MKRQIVLIIALSHFLGTLGGPVVAYSCLESGEVGVVPYLSRALESCYADACCEGHEGPAHAASRSASRCCDLDIQITLENGRMLVPVDKFGEGDAPQRTTAHNNVSLPDVRMASAQPTAHTFHPPINLPLLI